MEKMQTEEAKNLQNGCKNLQLKAKSRSWAGVWAG